MLALKVAGSCGSKIDETLSWRDRKVESRTASCYSACMSSQVQSHYQSYPYPCYPLLASVRRCDTYALNLDALWACFNGRVPAAAERQILIAGCGTFSPYPWSIANPDASITALDLSQRTLGRARLHCLLHGRSNVVYRCGDLLDAARSAERYAVIDSFGVLHHLSDPLDGLKALEKCLLPGGIIRIMLYSRYARREEESIRRAFRLMGICNPHQAKHLLRRARPGSRLANYVSTAEEARYDNGIADALLHPCVHTYRIDELLETISQSGLQPLLFAHQEAYADIEDEIRRLRRLEQDRLSPGNFILYLRKGLPAGVDCTAPSCIMLNPCLRQVVSPFTFGTIRIQPRIGRSNPPLDSGERTFLRRFARPVRRDSLSSEDTERVATYKQALFLMEFKPSLFPGKPCVRSSNDLTYHPV